MTHHVIISAVGANITGIVAQISREIYACGCNFEDSRMMFLGTHFSLMILVTGEQADMYEKLHQACHRLREEQDLSVTVFRRDAAEDETGLPKRPDYEIRVKGRDRIGIVYRTSQLLAALGINIVEMETSVDSSETDNDCAGFSMRILAAIPPELDVEKIRRKLDALTEDFSETVSFSPLR
jgi:glycine cleavage system transcriptional repressor